MDYTTINLTKLRKLPITPYSYRKVPMEHNGLGSGCSGDPPGYPSYFITSFGPHCLPECGVIQDPETGKYHELPDYSFEHRNKLLRQLWLPLQLDHPRTRLWILDKYRHHHDCWHAEEIEGRWSDDMVISPAGTFGKTPFGELKDAKHTPKDFDKWTAEHQTKWFKEITRHNDPILATLARIFADPNNHDAVRLIRRFYPEYQPEPDLIAKPTGHIELWWETEAVKPTPERCNATQRNAINDRTGHWKHPINGKWCQWCGWKEGQ